jgi:hypothetical protein
MVAGLTSHVGNSSVEQEVGKILYFPPKSARNGERRHSDCAAFRSQHVLVFAYLSPFPNIKKKLEVVLFSYLSLIKRWAIR